MQDSILVLTINSQMIYLEQLYQMRMGMCTAKPSTEMMVQGASKKSVELALISEWAVNIQ